VEGGRLPALDGLRGLAILGVLAHNLWLLDAPASGLARVAGAAFDHGWIGVQVFFALSGYLITGVLLDARDTPHRLRDFYARRALRIFPLYYMLLAVLWLPGRLVPDAPACATAWPYWLYLSNWTQPWGWHSDACVGPTWSLAVEEQFYLLWPLLVARRAPSTVLKLCIAVALGGVAWRLGALALAMPAEAIYTATPSRIDALAIGGVLAAWQRLDAGVGTWHTRAHRWLALAAGLFAAGGWLTGGYPRLGVANQAFGYTLLAACAGLVLASAVGLDRAQAGGALAGLLRARPLRALGTWSYGLYLLHKPLDKLVGRPLLVASGFDASASATAALGYLLACSLLSLAVAMLCWRFVERPFLALKARF
jgi:peptidoglycan/LPS O-acetylase OafA/YrhL